jgi:hypothetical protein
VPLREISVALDNTAGKLSEMADCLRESGITVLALCISRGKGATSARFIASDPQKAANTLRTHSYEITEKEVVAVEIPDHPGGLNAVLRSLKERSIQIYSLYTGLGIGKQTVLVIDVDRMSDAVKALQENWVRILN